MTARRRSKAIYLDTGPLYALADKRDQHHPRALSIFASLEKAGVPLSCPISNLLELHTLTLRRKLKNAAAIAQVAFENYGPVYPQAADMQAALEAVAKFNDQRVTLADAVLAGMARRAGAQVFTFDERHFALLSAEVYQASA
ncbi:MAG: PIN domain-containing protein [Deinococcota bacterium]|nr:PIN domain-containing protein [Deinococcota bacterium]